MEFSVDVIRHICLFLHPFSIAKLRLLSKKWKRAIDEGDTWSRALERVWRVGNYYVDPKPTAHESLQELCNPNSQKLMFERTQKNLNDIIVPNYLMSFNPNFRNNESMLFFFSCQAFCTPILFAFSETYGWEWTPDGENWMPISQVVVQGGVWKGHKPAASNMAICKTLQEENPRFTLWMSLDEERIYLAEYESSHSLPWHFRVGSTSDEKFKLLAFVMFNKDKPSYTFDSFYYP